MRRSHGRGRRRRVKFDMRDMLLCDTQMVVSPENNGCQNPATDMIAIDVSEESGLQFSSENRYAFRPININVLHWAAPADVGALGQNTVSQVTLAEAIVKVPLLQAQAPDLGAQIPAFVPQLFAGALTTAVREWYDVVWRRISFLKEFQYDITIGPPDSSAEMYLMPNPSPVESVYGPMPLKSGRIVGEREALFYLRNAWYQPFSQDAFIDQAFTIFTTMSLRYGVRYLRPI